ncbi:Asp-tRNA(Asn)/Glu-tRNA(Gln) amidotransferase subunit GatC [bacterium]|nr:Asp-tRNA(Asn)/Glu-tRNA(Gln) amidotransferase subunit GatC [bacterium]
MITQDTVHHVAKLARLELEPAEEAMFTEQLGAILGYVEQLQELDTTGVAPTAHPLPLRNVTRGDVLAPSLTQAEVLQNAPAAEQGMFRVPKILSE